MHLIAGLFLSTFKQFMPARQGSTFRKSSTKREKNEDAHCEGACGLRADDYAALRRTASKCRWGDGGGGRRRLKAR